MSKAVPPKAVVDLGTNTFHILIFRYADGKLQTILKERIFVKLAEGGIGEISKSAFARALAAMKRFRGLMDKHEVRDYRAVGTAALRRASNGAQLVEEITLHTGLSVDIIDGKQEAEYISLGVQQLMDSSAANMVMDIGGGSVEFIVREDKKIRWLVSLPIGVAVLYDRFHEGDPIALEEEQKLRSFLRQHLSTLAPALKEHQPTMLIGASGTFDVMALLLGAEGHPFVQVTSSSMHTPLQDIVKSTKEERQQNPLIPDARVDMIVVAAILIQEILGFGDFTTIGISQYALKEGVAYDMNF